MRPPDESGQPNQGRQTPRGGNGGEPPTEPMESYVRLHAHIEALRADRRPPQPGPLAPEEAGAYAMAALFHAAGSGADTPDPAFIANLRARLEREAADLPPARASGGIRPHGGLSRRGLSRRGILAGGLGAAAAMVAGAVIGSELTRPWPPGTSGTAIVVPGQGQWVAVADASAAAFPVGSVKWFSTSSIVGFVRRIGDHDFSALSGVCTHMGCLLQWNGSDRTFDCPCHGGRFTEEGASAPSSPVQYSPLPALQTKVEQDQVWVYVAAPGPHQQGTEPASPYGGEYGDT